MEQQVKQLESESSPETKKIIEDTMSQLTKLEADYKQLENDLMNGGDGKLILSAMIQNFQTRIDLLQDVIDQIETIKNLKIIKMKTLLLKYDRLIFIASDGIECQ